MPVFERCKKKNKRAVLWTNFYIFIIIITNPSKNPHKNISFLEMLRNIIRLVLMSVVRLAYMYTYIFFSLFTVQSTTKSVISAQVDNAI